MPSCGKNYVFNLISGPKLLLESHKLLRESLAVFFWDVFQSVLEENFRSVILTLPYLKLGELDEELLIE